MAKTGWLIAFLCGAVQIFNGFPILYLRIDEGAIDLRKRHLLDRHAGGRPYQRLLGAILPVAGAQGNMSLVRRAHHVWGCDFVHDQLANGGMLKMQCVLDAHTRERLASEVANRCEIRV